MPPEPGSALVSSGKAADHLTADDAITDAARACPHTTYGMTKAHPMPPPHAHTTAPRTPSDHVTPLKLLAATALGAVAIWLLRVKRR